MTPALPARFSAKLRSHVEEHTAYSVAHFEGGFLGELGPLRFHVSQVGRDDARNLVVGHGDDESRRAFPVRKLEGLAGHGGSEVPLRDLHPTDRAIKLCHGALSANRPQGHVDDRDEANDQDVFHASPSLSEAAAAHRVPNPEAFGTALRVADPFVIATNPADFSPKALGGALVIETSVIGFASAFEVSRTYGGAL